MFDMRLRIPELMEAKKIPTAYALQKASKGRLSLTNATHLVEMQGNTSRISLRVLDILCDIFEVDPNGLIER